MFLVSSNRIYKTDNAKAIPLIMIAKRNAITKTIGKKIEKLEPEMKTTITNGTKPIMKFKSAEIEDESVKICGGTATFVRTDPLFWMASALATKP